jgi:hypothetical protein
VKNHDFTPKNHIFPNLGGGVRNFWGISCEKSRFYAKKRVFVIKIARRKCWMSINSFKHLEAAPRAHDTPDNSYAETICNDTELMNGNLCKQFI